MSWRLFCGIENWLREDEKLGLGFFFTSKLLGKGRPAPSSSNSADCSRWLFSPYGPFCYAKRCWLLTLSCCPWISWDTLPLDGSLATRGLCFEWFLGFFIWLPKILNRGLTDLPFFNLACFKSFDSSSGLVKRGLSIRVMFRFWGWLLEESWPWDFLELLSCPLNKPLFKLMVSGLLIEWFGWPSRKLFQPDFLSELRVLR